MDAKSPRRGRVPYLKEGFIVHWDEQVMSVEVIDYHATVLRMAWADVLALAAAAKGAPSASASKSRSKRAAPPEA